MNELAIATVWGTAFTHAPEPPVYFNLEYPPALKNPPAVDDRILAELPIPVAKQAIDWRQDPAYDLLEIDDSGSPVDGFLREQQSRGNTKTILHVWHDDVQKYRALCAERGELRKQFRFFQWRGIFAREAVARYKATIL